MQNFQSYLKLFQVWAVGARPRKAMRLRPGLDTGKELWFDTGNEPRFDTGKEPRFQLVKNSIR